jgi:hypothetical protein
MDVNVSNKCEIFVYLYTNIFSNLKLKLRVSYIQKIWKNLLAFCLLMVPLRSNIRHKYAVSGIV